MDTVKMMSVLSVALLLVSSTNILFARGEDDPLEREFMSPKQNNSKTSDFSDDVVSYWKMEDVSEDVTNDSAGENNGDVIGGVASSEGIVNGDLKFDLNDHIKVPHDSSLNLNDEITIGGWIEKSSTAIPIGSVRTAEDWGIGTFNGTTVQKEGDSLKMGYRDGLGGDSLKGYWRLDEEEGEAIDHSGEENNGTVIGDINRGTTGVFSSQAFSFDGNDDKIDVGKLLQNGSDEITISAWILHTNSEDDRVICKSTGTAIQDHIYSLGVTGNTVRIRLKAENSSDDNYDATSYNIGEWQHTAFTYNGSSLDIYINGVKQANYSMNGSIAASEQETIIGNVNMKDGRYFDGKIDEVQVYKRGLSEQEVKGLYFSGSSGKFNGRYSSKEFQIPQDEKPLKIRVDSSGLDNVGNDTTVRVDTTNGKTESFKLDAGSNDRNYSLDFDKTGGEAKVSFLLNSTDPTHSPSIDDFTLYTTNSTDTTMIGKKGAYGLYLNSTHISSKIGNKKVSHPLTGRGYKCIFMTYNGSQQRLYLNGDLKERLNTSGSIPVNDNDLFMGRDLEGRLDEIAIFDRSLTEEEIRHISEKSKRGYGYLTDIVWVDDDYDSSTEGWGYDHFARIQDGIDNVSGSTVLVNPGHYRESITINKTVNLFGRAREKTVIDGGTNATTVRITADHVNMTGFSIKNGTSGIYIGGDHTSIKNTTVSGVYGNNGTDGDPGAGEDGGMAVGIYIDGADNTSLINNVIENIHGGHGGNGGGSEGDPPYAGGKGGEGLGIYLSSAKYSHILNNSIHDIYGGLGGGGKTEEPGGSGGDGGSALGLGMKSSYLNTVNHSSMTNIYGGDGGDTYGSGEAGDGGFAMSVSFDQSSNNSLNTSLLSNTVGGGGGTDQSLGPPGEPRPGLGLVLNSSHQNLIRSCNVENNDLGIVIDNSPNNTLYYNNLIQNSNQNVFSSDNSSYDNTWHDGNGTGNFWDDYNGKDDGSNNRTMGDGIGDTDIPHPVNNQGNGYYHLDNYPIIEPWPLLNPADGSWPMFGYDPKHKSRSPYNTSHVDGTVKWTFSTGGNIQTQPAIDANGSIYFGTDDNKLYALDSDGTEKWNNSLGAPIKSSPTIGNDGMIYLGANDSRLHTLYAKNGTEKWSRDLGGNVKSSPVISNGTIYVGANDHYLHALTPDGTEKWNKDLWANIHSSPAIFNGTIYIGSDQPGVFGIPTDGSSGVSYSPQGNVRSSPAIADGTIYVGADDGNLYALRPNLTEKWNYSIGGNIHCSPAIGVDGTIYIGSDSGSMYALNPNGTERWNFTTSGGIKSSPAIGEEGTIYFGSDDGNFYAVHPNGTEKWSHYLGNNIHSSPSIGPDGRIYVGTDGINRLYCFGGSYDVNVSAPSDEREIDPGIYSYDFMIKNEGSLNDTYDLSVDSDNPNFIPENPEQISLEGGEEGQVTVEVEILDSVTSGENAQISLNATSTNKDGLWNNDSMNITFEDYGVKVTGPQEKIEDTTGNFTYQFWVNNTGTIDDTYMLNVTSDSPYFSTKTNQTVTVPGNSSYKVDVRINISSSVPDFETGRIMLTAESQNSTANDTSATRLTYGTRDVNVDADKDGIVTEISSYNYTFWVNNTGYLNDTYGLSINSNRSGFNANGPDQVSVEGEGHSQVNIRIEIEPTVSPGETGMVEVEAVSQNKSSVTSSDRMNITYETRGVLVTGPEDVMVTSTDPMSYNYWVNNTGTLSDSYDLLIESDDPGFSASGPSSITLEGKESVQVEVTVEADSSISPGVMANITVEATSQNESYVNDSHLVEIRYETYGVDVEAPSDTSTSSPGLKVYDFLVNNTGSLSDTYSLAVDSTDPDFDVEAPPQVSLASSESKYIEVRVNITSSSEPGDSSMIGLTASSQNSTSNSTDSMVVTYSAYDVSVTAPSDQIVHSPRDYTYDFLVNNTGTKDDTYELTVVSDNSLFNVDVQETVKLDSGGSTPVKVTVSIDNSVSSGQTANIELTASSQNSTISSKDSMRISYQRAEDGEKPSSKVNTLPKYVTNQSFEIEFNASDNVELMDVSLFYRYGGEDWKFWTKQDVSGKSVTGAFLFTAENEGNYEFYTVANDSAGNTEDIPDQYDENITVDTTSPTVSITDPKTDILINTSDIEVRWTGDDEVSGLDTYKIVIDNSTWTDKGMETQHRFTALNEGSHLVQVKAIDRAGNEKSVDLQFKVDSKPPTVSINSPEDGEVLTDPSVTIDWSAEDNQTSIVRYDVRLNGRNWTDVGTKTSHPYPSLSDGDYTVEVRSVDEAGNTRIKKVEFTVKSEDKSPAEGFFTGSCGLLIILLILLAIILVLALITWRRRESEEGAEVESETRREETVPAPVEGKDEERFERHETEEAEGDLGSEEDEIFGSIDVSGEEEKDTPSSEEELSEEVEKQIEEALSENVDETEGSAKTVSPEETRVDVSEEVPEEGTTPAGVGALAAKKSGEEKEGVKSPIARAGESRTVKVGEEITFDGADSTDEKGIVSYEWYFGELGTGFGEVTQHAFEEPGKHLVKLVVTNEEGVSDEDSIEVTVERPPKEEVVEQFKRIKGIGPSMADRIYESGFQSLTELKEAGPEDLQEIKGIGESLSKKIYERLQEME